MLLAVGKDRQLLLVARPELARVRAAPRAPTRRAGAAQRRAVGDHCERPTVGVDDVVAGRGALGVADLPGLALAWHRILRSAPGADAVGQARDFVSFKQQLLKLDD